MDNLSIGNLNTDEPQPEGDSDDPAIQDLVIQDLQDRKELGKQKYGQALKPNNGRDALKDLYQELMDALVYLRQVIYERDNQ